MSQVGVLLIQLGTPDEPTVPAVRRYLREFLSDPRIIEGPRLVWLAVLNLQVLRTRPALSAAKYQRIWDAQKGFPLLYYTARQAEGLRKLLPSEVAVRFAMRYGNPSIASVVGPMIEEGLERLIVLPMYPQYSATSTGSALDGLFQSLMRERRVPALRTVPPYYEHAAYIEALARLIKEDQARLANPPDHFLLSFHGIPLSYTQRGDPYAKHVQQTSRRLVEKLGWTTGQWTQSYQSLFGKEEWLKPYTDETLRDLARRGVKRVYAVTPGFTADCLETIDELGFELRELFKAAGGEELYRCPCLNDHPIWLEALAALVREEGRGWI